MVEPEIAYCDIEEDMVWAEKLILFIIERVLENRKSELEVLDRDLFKLESIKEPFPRVSYTECVDILNKGGT